MKEICSGLQFALNHKNNWSTNVSLFLDTEFTSSRKILYAQMKESARLGFNKPTKKARAISREKEDKLWNVGVLGSSTPKQLLYSLIFYFGIHFSLRAAQEHRDLQFGPGSQLILMTDKDGAEYIQYTKNISKNRRYGIKCTRMEPKSTRLYARADDPTRYPIQLYKAYLSHHPETNNGHGNPAFYLAYIPNPTTNVWYKSCPLGIHSIQSATKSVMQSIGHLTLFMLQLNIHSPTFCTSYHHKRIICIHNSRCSTYLYTYKGT